ncbi:helix-turn-helix domain-containing protein [Dyella sp. 2HG41-7]|uniref:helix-turn-helix domain-containing protein n=1 Tax=Dyella sp. 2HG41-7 TaxID=2883239 RepID=UPI001F2FEEAF|nr:helix-turn-helix domain-containing protein [Dyella sp. 2HG41-7]
MESLRNENVAGPTAGTSDARTSPIRPMVATGADEDSPLVLAAQVDAENFCARVRLVIRRAGSMRALAERCGVSERTVQSWRSSRSDISLKRCMVLARVLHVSPVWLISGEGDMTNASTEPTRNANGTGVDSERLAAAMQLLQSYVVLAGGSLTLAQRAESIAELYTILSWPGPSDAFRLIAFQQTLAAYVRSNRGTVIA